MKNILRKSSFGFTKWCVALIAAGWMGGGTGFTQTAPTAQSLPFNVNFGTTTFTTLPAGVAVWNGLSGGSVSTQTLAEGSAPTANATLAIATASTTSGGAFGYSAASDGKLYIQTSSNASNGVNQPVIAIVTTGGSGITLAYTIDVINASSRTVGVVAQYRVGTSGGWTTLVPTSGLNPFSQAGGTAGLKTTASVTLPSAADNQPVVQIRWAVWRGTETGNSSGLALDNISVTTAPTVAPAAPVVASASAISTSGFTANWAASSGATKYFLDVATDSGFTSFVTGYQDKDVGNVIFSAVTGLDAGTTYYYRVRANNSAGTSASSQPQVALTTSAAAPSITPSTASLTGLSYNGAGPSTAQSLTLSVANLTGFPGTVTITGSTNYEVSTTSSSTGFGSSATLSYSDGNTLGSSTVWVRLKSGLAAGSYNGEIIGISGGDATSSFTASGSVTVPIISVTTTNLGSFIGTNGVGSAAKTNTITGTNLAGAVTMVATNYFQLSSDAGSTYTNTLILAPTAGVLSNSVLFRIAPNAPVGNLGTNLVTITSPGAADKTVQVAGVVVYGGVTMAIAGASTATVAEGGTPLTMDVTLSAAAPAGGTTVTLTTSDTDSSELGLSTTSVVFAEGETTKTVTLTPKTDSVFDTNQTIVITATAPDWSVAGTVSVTVSNVDAAPVSTIPLTSLATDSYTQSFDALGTVSIPGAISFVAGAQTSLAAATGSSTLNGWYATKIDGTGTSTTGFTAITPDAGAGSSGLVYSYGATSASDRALGVLASGSNIMAIGALIKNDTGGAIDGIKVSFTAEFWRSSGGTSAVQNILACAIGKVDGGTITTANFLTAGSAAPFISGNITGPAAVTTSAALNGNDAANQSTLTDVVIPLVLAPGETGFVRWSDVNDGGNDAGLAIDNLKMTAVVNSVPTPEFSLVGGIYLSDQNLKVSNFGGYAAGTTVYYTMDGSTPTSGSTVYNNTSGIALPVGNGPIVVKVIAIQGGLESFITSATYDLPKDVANLTALRASATGSTIYRVTGPVTFTAGTTFRKTKFFQDSGAGIQIDDFGGIITTAYLAGDNVRNIVGKIALFNGQLQMVPLQDFGPAVSSGNVVTPLSRTLATLTDADQARLVTIPGVEYQGANGTLVFTTATATINTAVRDSSTGATYSGWVRNIFSDSDVTGKVIPTGAVTVTGIVQKTLIGSVQSLTVGPRSSGEAGLPLALSLSTDISTLLEGDVNSTALLTISRSGPTTTDLTVSLSETVAGGLEISSDFGGSYTDLPVQLTIPAGLSSLSAELRAKDNSVFQTSALLGVEADGFLAADLIITITDNDPAGPSAPSNLSYTPSTISGTVGTAISSLTPTVTGTVDTYSVDPALPDGLSIDAGSGVISGTPTAVAASATYTVTAENAGGSTTTTVTVAVTKGTPTITVAPSASAITEGQALSDSVLSEGTASVEGAFAWTTPSEVPSVGTASYGVTFTPTDTVNYSTAATTVSVTVNAVISPLEGYLGSFGLSGANAAGTADPDGDGLNNAGEFAFGTSPVDGSSRAVTQTSVTGGIKITWLQRSGVTYEVKSTDNLGSGFSGPVSSSPVSPQPGGLGDYQQYEATLTGGDRGFIQVEATVP